MPDPEIQGVVQATGSIVIADTPDIARRLEQAMLDATDACYAEGVTDPTEILARKMAAHEHALAELNNA